MASFLPKSFRFSPLLTVLALLLATIMILASNWQWQRYEFKLALVDTYKENSSAPAIPFSERLAAVDLLHKKISVSGKYDYQHQFIVSNRKHRSGPGHWLLTPFQIDKSDKYIIVSRGFIPFVDDNEESWKKYSFNPAEQLIAVVQKSIKQKTSLSPGSSLAGAKRKWLYPDIKSMAKELSYPVISNIFLQRIGNPAKGEFPAEAITLRVPPSTHFGYSIEWAILAIITLLLAFLLQAFPRGEKNCIQSKEANNF